MDDMQFAKYAVDIREILEKTDQEGLETQVVTTILRQIGLHKNYL